MVNLLLTERFLVLKAAIGLGEKAFERVVFLSPRNSSQ